MSFSLRDPSFVSRLNRVAAAAGGAITDSPSNYASLSQWFKADSLALTDGALVGTWVDSSPVVNTVSGGGTARPTFKTNIVGTLPVVRCTALNHLDGNNWNRGASSSFTVMFVLNGATSENSAPWSGGTANYARIASANTASLTLSTIVASSAFGSALSVRGLTVIRRSTNAVSFFENNTAQGTATCSGSGYAGQVGNMAGDICEIVTYDVARSDADLTALYNNYFKPKWNLP